MTLSGMGWDVWSMLDALPLVEVLSPNDLYSHSLHAFFIGKLLGSILKILILSITSVLNVSLELSKQECSSLWISHVCWP